MDRITTGGSTTDWRRLLQGMNIRPAPTNTTGPIPDNVQFPPGYTPPQYRPPAPTTPRPTTPLTPSASTPSGQWRTGTDDYQNAEAQWNARLAQLRSQPAQGSTAAANVPTYNAQAAPSRQVPNPPSPVQSAVASNAQTSTGGPSTAPGRPSYQSPSGTGVQIGGVGNQGGTAPRTQTGPWVQYPNAWWNDVPQATLGEFASDPEMVARAWTQEAGYGDQTRMILNNFADPVSLLYGLGHAENMEGNIPAQLDLVGQMYQQVLGGASPAQNQYVDPRSIIQRVLGAEVKYDPTTGARIGPANAMIDSIAGPNLSAQDQVQNTIRFLGASLQGLLPRQVYDSYMRTLAQEGETFILNQHRNPTNAQTFNKFIGARLGANGGL